MSAPARILHVITRLIRGGADENTALTVAGMDPARWDSWILAGRGSEPAGFAPVIRERTRLFPELVRDPDPVQDVVALAKLIRLLGRERWDLVHTHTAKAGFLGRVAARAAGVPHVVHTLHGVTFHEHVPAPVRRFYVLLERLAARRCDALVTVGEDVKRKYLAEGIGRPDQYVTIASGMDTAPFHAALADPAANREAVRAELGVAPADVAVGMVSRLEPRKGWSFLLDAAARLAPEFPAMRLLVVGEGAQREELEAGVSARGLHGRVVFTGYREDVARVIAAFDVAVLTSLWEGLPRVLVQYALLEKPIVTFDVEGAREVVEEGAGGWVVPSRDVDALVHRLRPLLADPGLRARCGRRGRERVGSRWDADRMIDRLEELYDAVRRGHPLPAACPGEPASLAR